MPPSSLLTSSQPTDPLPLYTRNAFDPETSSVYSSAPSYISDAPSYHSFVPRYDSSSITIVPATPRRANPQASSSPVQSPRSPARLLSSQQIAPGFRSRAFTAPESPDPLQSVNSLYNIAEWSPISSGLQARHYQNVANRRATAASETIAAAAALTMNGTGMGMQPIRSMIPRETPGERHVPVVPAQPAPLMSGALQPTLNNSSTSLALEEEIIIEDSDSPCSPHEDPDLVGEVAAARARSQRIYMAKETLAAKRRMEQEDMRLKEEAKMWDFMIAQMADWEERERSWKKFRDEVGRSRLLGRRLGLRRSR